MRGTTEWLTTSQIAESAKLNPRTTRAHARLAKAGLLQVSDAVTGGHRYRWAGKAGKGQEMLAQIEHAAEVLGAQRSVPGARR